MPETPYQADTPATAEEEDVHFRRPLAGLCISFVAGLVYGFDFLPPPVLIAILIAPLLVVVWWFAKERWSTPIFHAAVALAAAAYASLTANPPAKDYLGHLIERDAQSIEIIGTISDEPVLRDGERWYFPIRAEGCRLTIEWQNARGEVEVVLPVGTNSAAPAYGQLWHFSGLLTKQKAAGNRPPFKLLARSTASQIGMGPHSRFYSWCIDQRKRAATFLAIGMRAEDFPREAAMMRALLLGERSTLDEDTHKAFSRTGTLHIVAISGSHVAVFFVLLAYVLKSLGFARPTWFWFITPMLIVYTTMAGLPPSAVRACLMAIFLASASLLKRRGDNLNVIALSGLLILFIAPRDIYDAGFVLSFLLVIALVVLEGPLRRGILNLLPKALTEIPEHDLDDEPPAHKRFMRWSVAETTKLFAATLAAWLVAEPLMALYFNLRSPVALIVNLAIVPLAYFILLSGCISLVLGALVGSICPVVVEVFNHAGRLLISAMLWLVDRSAELPGAWQYVRQPPLFWVCVYFVLLLAIFFARPKIRRVALAVSALLIVWWAADYSFNRRATLEWFRIGATPVAFLDLPRENDVLINTGDARSSRELVTILHKRGVDRLHTLILTRPSGEALGGAEKLLAEIPADEVWINAWDGRSKIASNLVAHCTRVGIPLRELANGDLVSLAAGFSCEVLHPRPGQKYKSAAASGLALRFSRDDASFLYAGGGGPEFEAAMVAENRGFRSDLLLAGTEGRAPFGPEFLAAAAPRSVVIPQASRVSDEVSAATLAVPEFTPVAAISRHEYWRVELPPSGNFQSLEVLRRHISKLWNSSTNAWPRGEVLASDWW